MNNTRILRAILAASVLVSLPLLSSAQTFEAIPVIPAYLNGGVGQDEQDMMSRVAHEYPLRMTFSEKKVGQYVAGVDLVIVDSQGKQVFALPNAGPMLDVKLPNGKYHVTARSNGIAQTLAVTLEGRGGKDLHFHRQ